MHWLAQYSPTAWRQQYGRARYPRAVEIRGYPAASTSQSAGQATKAPALAEQRLDTLAQLARIRCRAETRDYAPLTINQKLGEIPFDGLAAEPAAGFGFQQFQQRRVLRASHADLGDHWKTSTAIPHAEIADSLIAKGILNELVGGQAKSAEALDMVVAIPLFTPSVLARESSTSPCVDDQQN